MTTVVTSTGPMSSGPRILTDSHFERYHPEVDLHETVADRLAGGDQRYTSNRRAVVEVLERTDRPLTIPEILGHRPQLAQSSVYRNLAVLEDTGVVHRVHGADDFARYELTEDLLGHHHHHLICSWCGAVADFTVPAEVEATLEATFDSVTGATGFVAEHHRLDLVGRCRACSDVRASSA